MSRQNLYKLRSTRMQAKATGSASAFIAGHHVDLRMSVRGDQLWSVDGKRRTLAQVQAILFIK